MQDSDFSTTTTVSLNSMLFIKWRDLVIRFILPALTFWGTNLISSSKSIPIRHGFSILGQGLTERVWVFPAPYPLESKFSVLSYSLTFSVFTYLQRNWIITLTTSYQSRTKFSRKDLDARTCRREIYWGTKRSPIELPCRFSKDYAAFQILSPASY